MARIKKKLPCIVNHKHYLGDVWLLTWLKIIFKWRYATEDLLLLAANRLTWPTRNLRTSMRRALKQHVANGLLIRTVVPTKKARAVDDETAQADSSNPRHVHRTRAEAAIPAYKLAAKGAKLLDQMGITSAFGKKVRLKRDDCADERREIKIPQCWRHDMAIAHVALFFETLFGADYATEPEIRSFLGLSEGTYVPDVLVFWETSAGKMGIILPMERASKTGWRKTRQTAYIAEAKISKRTTIGDILISEVVVIAENQTAPHAVTHKTRLYNALTISAHRAFQLPLWIVKLRENGTVNAVQGRILKIDGRKSSGCADSNEPAISVAIAFGEPSDHSERCLAETYAQAFAIQQKIENWKYWHPTSDRVHDDKVRIPWRDVGSDAGGWLEMVARNGYVSCTVGFRRDQYEIGDFALDRLADVQRLKSILFDLVTNPTS